MPKKTKKKVEASSSRRLQITKLNLEFGLESYGYRNFIGMAVECVQVLREFNAKVFGVGK